MAILREYSHILHQNKVTSVLAIRARRVPRRFSGVFIRGEPPNKKTTRQRIKTKSAKVFSV